MIHIQKFIERVQGFDARAAKDFIMPMKYAKSLHADITQLLLALQKLQDNANTDLSSTDPANEIIKIEVDGGAFK